MVEDYRHRKDGSFIYDESYIGQMYEADVFSGCSHPARDFLLLSAYPIFPWVTSQELNKFNFQYPQLDKYQGRLNAKRANVRENGTVYIYRRRMLVGSPITS